MAYLVYVVIGVVIVLELMSYLLAEQLGFELNNVITVSWFTTVIIFLWLGNRLITVQFNRYFPWLRFGKRRFYAHLATGIIYSLIIINLAYLLFKVWLTQDPPVYEQIVVMNAWGIVLFIPLFSIYFSQYFLSHWKRSEVVAEKFKKETLQAELTSLKGHLDPHFLFNNLNILSSLIDKDKKMSKDFLDKFAEVYRAILKSKDEDLISLEEEMDFIDAYMHLIKTRFEDNIQFNADIKGADKFKMLPPLTIQLLVENAIKHNVISEKRPLKLFIQPGENDYLVVENTLYPKPDDLREEGGTGLDNIRKRYAYFTANEVKVSHSQDYFRVSVPLLEVETI
ncbi:histidine kinase [Fulvivirga sp. M361]|uniref:sensor histidine kinase n=1 Tax=Fulvivirga sp. M361 TaxID=2594266 RepID=UPI00117AC749|nr:histidine kinase [Fulvivirga sp. M361]TRX55971.1 histidine kinase [Fulvivirga sp. M361]